MEVVAAVWGPLVQNGSGNASTNASSVYDQPEFVASVSVGGLMLVLVVAAHVQACKACCCTIGRKRRLQKLTGLQQAVSGGDGGAGRSQTPLINDESAPLLFSSPNNVGYREPGPDGYSWLSNLFLTWNITLVKLGYARALKREELPVLQKKFHSPAVHSQISSLWDVEVKTSNKPSLHSVMVTFLKGKIIAGSVVASVQGLLSTVARPLILRFIIEKIEEPGLPIDQITFSLVALGLVVFFEGWLGVLYRHLITEDMGTSFITAMFALLVEKITKMARPATKQQKKKGDGDDDDTALNTGEISNLFGNDIMKRFRDFLIASNLPMALSAACGAVGTLIFLLGIPALAGIGIMIFLLIVNVRISKMLGKIEHLNLQAADTRVGILTEIVSSIKAVKFFAWEEPYIGKITDARTKEVTGIRKFRMLQVTSIALGRASPALSACAAIVAYALSGNPLRAADIFATIAVFQSLRLSLIVLPHSLTSLETIKTSLMRLGQFMLQPEAPVRRTTGGGGGGGNNGRGGKQENALLSFENATLGWPHYQEQTNTDATSASQQSGGSERGAVAHMALMTLRDAGVLSKTEFVNLTNKANATVGVGAASTILSDVNFQLNRGEIVAVIGAVGSGKSTLVSTVIGELAALSGMAMSHDDIGYVPQRAVIVSGTVLENILFGREYNAARLRAAIDVSDFAHDLALLNDGLDSEIGSRGTTLSGGQQQRLSIARAVYGEPDLLVLDDPLSAVDPEVCGRIFTRCVLGQRARGGSVLLVCSQIHLLRCMDKILYLADGVVKESGTYAELMEADGEVANLVSSHVFEEQQDQQPQQDVDGLGSAGSGGGSRGSAGGADGAAARSGVASSKAAVENEARVANVVIGAHTEQTSKTSTMKREKAQQGEVSTAIYSYYFGSMGYGLVASLFAVIILGYSTMAFMDLWLTVWIGKADATPGDELGPKENALYGGVFIAASVGYTIFIWLGSMFYTIGGFRASKRLHLQTITKIAYAPFSWFQDTPIGRITSRYTTDLGSIDIELSLWLDNLSQLGCQYIAMIAVVIAIVPPAAIPVGVGSIVYYVASDAVNRANREIKREANAAMSPVQSNAVEAMHAKELARVMDCSDFFVERHHELANEFNRANYASFALMSWMQLVGVYVSFVISVFTGVWVVINRENTNPERGALALTYSFSLPYLMSMLAMIITNVKTWFTCLERVLELVDTPQEPEHWLPNDDSLTDWPNKGSITFENVSLRYAPHLPLVLKGISLTIPGGSRVGVVGRTGAGKSSLMSLIFRLVESSNGHTLIDNVKTASVGLHKLRKSISIIPQDPILMQGTVRYNLDPFGLRSEAALQEALEKAHLSPELLDSSVSDSGGNLSAGQRQLLCFARALLFPAPVVIMDEPTASCDLATDELIQAMVRTEFAAVTVLTIAHRLDTVIDSDTILVLGDGKVLEHGPPAVLLADDAGSLTSMVRALGPAAEQHLRRRAKSSGDV